MFPLCMRCYVTADGPGWKAYCLDLALSARGETPDAALDNLTRSLQLHLAGQEHDTLRALRESATRVPLFIRLGFLWQRLAGRVVQRAIVGPGDARAGGRAVAR